MLLMESFISSYYVDNEVLCVSLSLSSLLFFPRTLMDQHRMEQVLVKRTAEEETQRWKHAYVLNKVV